MASLIQRRTSRAARLALYRMKRVAGVPVQIQDVTTSGFNPETGSSTVSRTVQDVRRCVTFSVKQTSRFEYDLSYVAANKNFIHGGIFNVGDRIFILDARDVPANFEIRLDTTHIVFGSKKWDVASYEKLDHDVGYIIASRETQEAAPKHVVSRISHQILSFEQTISGEL